MRASRLVSLLLLLQTRGRLTAQQLADELEVSVRTVYRDVESLAAAGVPVYADRGPAGGYRLLDGYRTRLTGLTSEEAESLALAGMPGPAAALGLGTVLAAAQLKLAAALPPELRSRAGRIRERFHLDAPGWFRGAEPPEHLGTVADAVWHQHPLRMRYRRWDCSEVDRTVHPLGLVLKAGAWYLVGRCGDRDRSYRVERILAVDAMDGRFDRPADFDLAAYWRSWSERFEAQLYGERVVVRMSPRAVELASLVNPLARRAVEETAGRPDADGWVTVTLPTESMLHARHALLQLGPEVEVLQPAELRAAIADAAARTARLYALP